MAQFLGCCLFKPYQDFTRIYERLKSVLAFVALLRTGIYNVTALVNNIESSESGNLGEPNKRDCGPAQKDRSAYIYCTLHLKRVYHLTFAHNVLPTLTSSDTQEHIWNLETVLSKSC